MKRIAVALMFLVALASPAAAQVQTMRIGAEWCWTSVTPDGQGHLMATYPKHPSTGKTRIKFDSASSIWGWRYNTTVRPFTHEVLFALMLQKPDGTTDAIAAWTHHAWEPGGATKQNEVVTLAKPISVPAGSLLWVWVDGWGQQYGAPGMNATIAELQATIFAEGQARVMGEWGGSPMP